VPSVGNETNHNFNGATIQGGLAIEGAAGNTAYIDRDTAATLARQNLMIRKLGYYSESFPLGAAANLTTIQTSGTVNFSPVGLLKGDVVTNIWVRVTTLASGFSGIGAKVGLYTTAGVLLASSADVQASLGSTGTKLLPLTTPYTITSDDVYYLAIITIASTPPVMVRGVLGSTVALLAGTGTASYCGHDVSETDLPATAAILYTSGTNYWMAVS
jgi:hypothetical protein